MKIKTPVKITITKIPGRYAFRIECELNSAAPLYGWIYASDLFSLMSMEQYWACVKDEQRIFFMEDFDKLKPYIHK